MNASCFWWLHFCHPVLSIQCEWLCKCHSVRISVGPWWRAQTVSEAKTVVVQALTSIAAAGESSGIPPKMHAVKTMYRIALTEVEHRGVHATMSSIAMLMTTYSFSGSVTVAAWTYLAIWSNWDAVKLRDTVVTFIVLYSYWLANKHMVLKNQDSCLKLKPRILGAGYVLTGLPPHNVVKIRTALPMQLQRSL